jgi:hypothetical protein
MAGKSAIEWTDRTWNPVTGCTKTSPGCDNCYAARFSERFRGVPSHPFENGFDITIRPERLQQPFDWKKPRRIFGACAHSGNRRMDRLARRPRPPQRHLSSVFERHPRLTLAIVEFELSWAPNVLSAMDYTYRERHGEALYRFKNGMVPSDFFHRNVVLRFQEDAIGIRLRNMV